uniref:Uncharacterized protein TCIL3000_9_220 n=1 Tax=Trypanosoma congolense (strain IL3000) TaxID=1068625 RepID=G0UTB5_TRYCI|nr:unnamed protein product [Trypanosoma congolense IL3000]
MAAAEVGSPRDVFLFYPNLIGYLRVFLALTSFCILGRLPVLFLLCYTVSFVLDAVDGVVARRLGQCSQFGAVLDMVTDRASTVGLLIALVHVLQPLPGWGATLFAFLAFLDISSHFCRMYVSLSTGCNSHKDVSTSSFALMRFFTRTVLSCVRCVWGRNSSTLFYIRVVCMDTRGMPSRRCLFSLHC